MDTDEGDAMGTLQSQFARQASLGSTSAGFELSRKRRQAAALRNGLGIDTWSACSTSSCGRDQRLSRCSRFRRAVPGGTRNHETTSATGNPAILLRARRLSWR